MHFDRRLFHWPARKSPSGIRGTAPRRGLRPSRARAVLLACLVALFAASGLAAKTSSSRLPGRGTRDALAAFSAFCREQSARDGLTGLAVAAWGDGLDWAEGFGLADVENGVPVTPESAFRLASVSKTFTALAILQLAEAGRIRLDDDVRVYVPYFPKKKWPITVRQLLGHLGGISHYRDYDREGHIKEPKTTRQAVALFQDFDLIAEPGTRFHYSTYGYNLLGAVVEAASGEDYGTYLSRHVFEPLGMTRTRPDSPTDLIPGRVRGYRLVKGVLKNSEYVDISSRFGGGGLRSTVTDLARYAQGLIDGRLLTRPGTRLMWTSQAQRDGRLTGYGLGWSVGPWHGHFCVFHGGAQPESRTLLILLPAKRLALALASNFEEADLRPYALRLAELLLDEDLDSAAYTPDAASRLIDQTLATVFSRGLSYWEWNGRPLTDSAVEIERAFAFFNDSIDRLLRGGNVEAARAALAAGIHPSSGRPLTAMGSYMASVLAGALGRDALAALERQGPTAFFGRYIKTAQESGPGADSDLPPAFGSEFARLIAGWDRDWSESYTDSVRRLEIDLDVDFLALGRLLRSSFNGCSYYRDFSPALARAAARLLADKAEARAAQAVELALEIYPRSPWAVASAGLLGFWAEDFEAGRSRLREARALDPAHPATAPGRLIEWGSLLESGGKLSGALGLFETGLEFYPRDTDLLERAGDAGLALGDKTKARRYYRRALTENGGLASVKAKLKSLD
jgi:CubicO group peptidase (beta-lactamase class C family)